MNLWQLATGYLLAAIAFGSLIMARLSELSSGPPAKRVTMIDATGFFILIYLLWPLALCLMVMIEAAMWLLGGRDE